MEFYNKSKIAEIKIHQMVLIATGNVRGQKGPFNLKIDQKYLKSNSIYPM